MFSDEGVATLIGVFVSLVTTLFMYYVMSVEIKDEIKSTQVDITEFKKVVTHRFDLVNDRFDLLPEDFSKLFELKK
jgi:hypothetical protein